MGIVGDNDNRCGQCATNWCPNHNDCAPKCKSKCIWAKTPVGEIKRSKEETVGASNTPSLTKPLALQPKSEDKD